MTPSSLLPYALLLLLFTARAAMAYKTISTEDCKFYMSETVDYFTNPGFPAPMNKSILCGIRIIVKKSVHQLRLDMINFNIATADELFGNCDKDIMMVTNGDSSELRMCGSYNDRQLYYDVNDKEKDVIIYIIMGKGLFYRTWLIRITQLEPPNQVPRGCLQYYQGVVGIVNRVEFYVNGRDIVNQNNRICIQEFEGTCNIFYTPCNGSFDPRIGGYLSGNIIKPMLTVVPFKRDREQEILEDDFQNLCITYQQDPCQFSKYKPS